MLRLRNGIKYCRVIQASEVKHFDFHICLSIVNRQGFMYSFETISSWFNDLHKDWKLCFISTCGFRYQTICS